MLKPTFIFFKMIGCGHCDRFYADVWPALSNDKYLNIKVNFKILEIGGNAPPFPEQYAKYNGKIDYAPDFYLDFGNNVEAIHIPMETNRTYGDIKTWITENLKGGSNMMNHTTYNSKTDLSHQMANSKPKSRQVVLPNSLLGANDVQSRADFLLNRKYIPRNL